MPLNQSVTMMSGAQHVFNNISAAAYCFCGQTYIGMKLLELKEDIKLFLQEPSRLSKENAAR
jgi:hypothetical protein